MRSQLAFGHTPALEDAANRGLMNRIGADPPEWYRVRLKYELDRLANAFGDVFVYHRLSDHARRHGLRIGPGRGSLACSLVLWCLGITDIDPIRSDLPFERWFNPLRHPLRQPEVNIDLEVPEAALDDFVRAIPLPPGRTCVRLPLHEVLYLECWPGRWAQVALGREACFQPFPTFDLAGETWTFADRHTMERRAAHIVDLIGTPVLSVLTTLQLPPDNERGLSLLRAGNVEGIHGLERAPELGRMLADVRPSHMDDLAALYSLYPWGPIDLGLLRSYAKHCRSNTRVSPKHPALEPILANTRGLLIYQEQLMNIVATLAGFSLDEADIIRRELGKKSRRVPAIREDFCVRCVNGGISFEQASSLAFWLFSQGGLLLSRAHALSMSAIMLETANAKALHPARYLSRLRSEEAAASGRHRAERALVMSAFGRESRAG
jgi:DNA polymerase III alpha subunit